MNSYWNKQETKRLTDEILVGWIANKIPVTPLLFAIKLNNERACRIKSDIDYSQTSESGDNEEDSQMHNEKELSSSKINQSKSIIKQRSKNNSSVSLSTTNKVKSKETVSIEVLNNPLGNAQTSFDAQIKQNGIRNYIVSEDIQVFEETKQANNGHIPVGKSNSFQPKQFNQEIYEIVEEMNEVKPKYQKPPTIYKAQSTEIEEIQQPLVNKQSPEMRERGKSVLIKLLQKEKEVKERRSSKDMTAALNAFIKAAKPPTGKKETLKNK